MRFPLPMVATGNWRASDGAAAVELGLVLPFLIWLILGVIDFGGYMNSSQAIAAATRVGAEYARDSAVCKSTATGVDIINDVVNATCIGAGNPASGIEGAMQSAMNFSPALTFPTAPFLTCQCDDGTKANPNTTSGCGNYSCAQNNRPAPNRVFITVGASQAISPILGWAGFPTAVTGSTQIRLQ
jgi:Flp pilus assembly protein TadG